MLQSFACLGSLQSFSAMVLDCARGCSDNEVSDNVAFTGLWYHLGFEVPPMLMELVVALLSHAPLIHLRVVPSEVKILCIVVLMICVIISMWTTSVGLRLPPLSLFSLVPTLCHGLFSNL